LSKPPVLDGGNRRERTDPCRDGLREMLIVRVMSRVNAVRNYTMALDELFEAVRRPT